MSIGTGSLTTNSTPTADVMAKRILSPLFALSRFAESVTPSGLMASTFFTNTTDSSGTVKTYASVPVTPIIIYTTTTLVAYLVDRSDEGRFRGPRA